MQNEIKAMSAEKTSNFIKRVIDDLEVADGFVGITKEQILELKLKEALAAYTKFLLESTPTENRKCRSCYQSFNGGCGCAFEVRNETLDEVRSFLQDQIDQLTK